MTGQTLEQGAAEEPQVLAERFAYAALDALSEHVAVLDEAGTILAVNRAWREFAGANSPSPAGLSEGANYLAACASATGEGADYAARFAAGLRAVFEGRSEEFQLEYPCHSAGERRWFIARAKRFGVGGEARALVTHANVTARRLAEEERERLLADLESERSRLAYLFERAPSFVAVLRGPDHVFELANPHYLELVGNRDVLGKPVREALPEIEGQGYPALLDQVFRTGEPHAGRDVRVLLGRESGREEERFLDFVYQPMFDAAGGVSGIFVHGVDITEHRRAEDRARASEERYRMLFSSIDEGFGIAEVLFDEAGRGFDHRFLEVNPSFEKETGIPVGEVLSGKTVGELVPGVERHWSETYGRVVLTGEPERFVGGSDALGRWFDVYAFRAGRPEERRVAVLFTDITGRRLAEERLRESEGRYRLLLEQASDGIHTYDLRGDFIETNPKLCEMLGYTREELLRLNVADLVPPGDLAASPIRFDRLREGETVLTERLLLRKDGTLLPVEISGRMVSQGVMQSIVRDISERRRAEEALRGAYGELERRVEERTAELARANETLRAENSERLRAEETLRENEQRLRVALQTGNLGSWQLDLATFELDCSPTCKANFGRPPDAAFTYQDLFAAIHPEDRGGVRATIEGAVEGRSDYHAEYRALWPDGSTHWIVAHGRGIYDAAGAPLRMVGVTIDITERRGAEEERRELLRRLVAAQEEERRRISRELHDQVGQQLAALMMGLKALNAESHGRQSALATLRQLQGLTDELSREVHTLAWGLRPPALDDLGLHKALYNYAEEWAERSRVAVDFHSAGFEGGRLPFPHETALYRIAQEALTNVLKHSGADRVSVILERRADHVLAVVEDNGRGFDVETLTGPRARGHRLGLLGMRERAVLLGGTLNVESAPGAGTSVFVRIPVGPGAGGGGEQLG